MIVDIEEYNEKILSDDGTKMMKRNYEQQIRLLNQENGNMKIELDNLRRRQNNTTSGGKYESL